MNPHVFAGNPLDRGDTYRRDQAWLEAQAINSKSRFLPLWQLNVLIQAEQCAGGITAHRPSRPGLRPFSSARDGVAHPR
jgi:hypothetical protein